MGSFPFAVTQVAIDALPGRGLEFGVADTVAKAQDLTDERTEWVTAVQSALAPLVGRSFADEDALLVAIEESLLDANVEALPGDVRAIAARLIR